MRKYTVLPVPEEPAFLDLAKEVNSKEAAQVIWNRNIHSVAEFNETIKGFSWGNFAPVYDVEAAGKTIKEVLDRKGKIAVYGDYDADGALAATILWRFFYLELGNPAIIYIPDRHEEGYGLNRDALEKLANDGYELIITVDCGVRDRDLIKEFQKVHPEVKIVVTDHHQPGDTFPECPTVHPLYPGHESSARITSGGVVAWKLVRYLEDLLKRDHVYSESVVDLAGISLVTDMMPLTGENRFIVKHAIQKIQDKPTLGIEVLLESAQVQKEKVSTYHLGFVIGPRLNASGRIADPYLSSRLLSTQQEQSAREYARNISDINKQRQDLTQQMLLEAEEIKIVVNDRIMVVAKAGWDDGVIGLVAGKLMNKHDIPTIAISIDEKKNIAKGSARSFGELNITEVLEKMKDVLARYGGHQSAAGFTLATPEVEPFIETLRKTLEQEYQHFIPVAQRKVDAEITAASLTDSFFDTLALLEPFGQENPAPLFLVKGKVLQFATMGQLGNHIRIQLQTETGPLKVLFFDGVSKVGNIEQGNELLFVGKPQLEEYNGNVSPSFIVEALVTIADLQYQ